MNGPDVISSDARVLETQAAFRKSSLAVSSGTRTSPFDHTEQCAIDHCGDDLLLRHGSHLGATRWSEESPSQLIRYVSPSIRIPTSPLLQRVDEGMRCCSVSFPTAWAIVLPFIEFCFILVVAFRTTVKETAVKLICGARFPDTTHRPEVYLSASHDH